MPEIIKYSMRGLEELQRKLKVLAPQMAAKVVKASLEEGSDMILKAMRATVSRDTGFLEKNLGKRIRIFRNMTSGVAYMGPEGKMDYPKKGTYIEKLIRGQMKKVGRVAVATVARFLEFGTSKMTARPFMTRSFEKIRPAVSEAVVEKLRQGLKTLGV